MHAVGVPVLLCLVFFLPERNKKMQGKARTKDLLLQGRERESKGKDKQSKEIDPPRKAA